MQGRVAVIAALPREIKALVEKNRPASGQAQGISLYETERAVYVAAGMGAARVSLAFQAALRAGGVAEVLSVGLAGACTPSLRAGDVVEPGRVIDVRTGERFETMSSPEATVLVSTEAIASVAEKARLRATYDAGIADMEAATVARLAMAHGLGFRAVKGISDAFDFELASLDRFAGPRGEFRNAAFALYTALHPASWRDAVILGKNSTAALTAMSTRIQDLLPHTSR